MAITIDIIKDRIKELEEFIQKLDIINKEIESPGICLINFAAVIDDPFLIDVGRSILSEGYKTKGYRKMELCKEYNISFGAACDYKSKTKDIMKTVIFELTNLLNDRRKGCVNCRYLDESGRSFSKDDYNIYRCECYGLYNQPLDGCVNFLKCR